MRKRIGELLIEAGLITSIDLDAALHKQRKHGGRIGRILVEAEVLSDEALVNGLAAQLDVMIAKFPDQTPNGISLVPRKVAEKHMLCPLEKTGDTLVLAMADPTNQEAVDAIQGRLRCRIVTRIASEPDIERAIRCYYSDPNVPAAPTDPRMVAPSLLSHQPASFVEPVAAMSDDDDVPLITGVVVGEATPEADPFAIFDAAMPAPAPPPFARTPPASNPAPTSRPPQPAPFAQTPQPAPFAQTPQPAPFVQPFAQTPQPAPFAQTPQPAPFAQPFAQPSPAPFAQAPQQAAPQPAPFAVNPFADAPTSSPFEALAPQRPPMVDASSVPPFVTSPAPTPAGGMFGPSDAFLGSDDDAAAGAFGADAAAFGGTPIDPALAQPVPMELDDLRSPELAATDLIALPGATTDEIGGAHELEATDVVPRVEAATVPEAPLELGSSDMVPLPGPATPFAAPFANHPPGDAGMDALAEARALVLEDDDDELPVDVAGDAIALPGNALADTEPPVELRGVAFEEPGAAAPFDLEPVDQAPAESAPVELAPVELEPVELEPVDVERAGFAATAPAEPPAIEPAAIELAAIELGSTLEPVSAAPPVDMGAPLELGDDAFGAGFMTELDLGDPGSGGIDVELPGALSPQHAAPPPPPHPPAPAPPPPPPSLQPVPATEACADCGSVRVGTARFCTNCGRPFVAAPPPAAAPPAFAASQPAAQPPAPAIDIAALEGTASVRVLRPRTAATAEVDEPAALAGMPAVEAVAVHAGGAPDAGWLSDASAADDIDALAGDGARAPSPLARAPLHLVREPGFAAVDDAAALSALSQGSGLAGDWHDVAERQQVPRSEVRAGVDGVPSRGREALLAPEPPPPPPPPEPAVAYVPGAPPRTGTPAPWAAFTTPPPLPAEPPSPTVAVDLPKRAGSATMMARLSPEELRALAERLMQKGALTPEDVEAAKKK